MEKNKLKGKERGRLIVSAPGRICLFGEHQDYLGLPVIPCAISLRICIEGKLTDDSTIHLDLPDINDEELFTIQEKLPYVRERDYFRSVVNVLRRDNFTFSRGFDGIVRGKIPINSGTSSSSALTVAWVQLLAQLSDQSKTILPEVVAKLAHRAEVLEFSEPGGMMDHYSTSIGGILFLEFWPEVRYELLDTDLKTFVLGDSGEPKDTKTILARVKNRVIHIAEMLSKKHPDFSLHSATQESIRAYRNELNSEEYELLEGTVRNHRITHEARRILCQDPLNHKKLGELLNATQDVLRDVLKISTPKIDRMLDAAMGAGAYGGKINGSGGGGCMFAYAPENPEEVMKAVDKVGGKGYIVRADQGVRNDATGVSKGTE